ncbi:MAG: hypothetical protein ABI333_29640 [bacterium]
MRFGQFALAAVIGAFLMLLPATPAPADTIFSLDLPLTSQADTQAAVNTYGGQIYGGQFGPGGWTTQTRDDFIEVDLPYLLDTREGHLEVTVADLEMSPPFTTHYWQFELVAIDPYGALLSMPPVGHAHLASGYRGYWDAGADNVAQAFWNLYDAACTAWQDCTTETGSGANYVSAPGAFTFTHDWQAQTQWVTFGGNGQVSRTMDLSPTSPGGVFQEDQMILTINVCGGSSAVICGSWDEPANRGGPLGVTYSAVRLEIYGDVDAAVQPDAGGGDLDAGADGSTPTNPDGAIGADGAAADSGVDGAQAADAQDPGGGTARGGCACRTSDTHIPSLTLLLLLLVLCWIRWSA